MTSGLKRVTGNSRWLFTRPCGPLSLRYFSKCRYSALPSVVACNTPSERTEATCAEAIPETSSLGLSGVLKTFESTPASRSWNVGVHTSGPETKRPWEPFWAKAGAVRPVVTVTSKTMNAGRMA